MSEKESFRLSVPVRAVLEPRCPLTTLGPGDIPQGLSATASMSPASGRGDKGFLCCSQTGSFLQPHGSRVGNSLSFEKAVSIPQACLDPSAAVQARAGDNVTRPQGEGTEKVCLSNTEVPQLKAFIHSSQRGSTTLPAHKTAERRHSGLSKTRWV